MMTTVQETLRDIINDDEKCIQTFFKVVPKEASTGLVPFVFRPAQQKLMDAAKKYRRILVLKPRQVGSTTFWAALLFRRTMYIPHCTSVLVAHETAITERLFNRTDVFYQELPAQLRVPLDGDSTRYKKFQHGGTMFIGTAGAQVFGRGDTVHNLLASEVAFWRDDHIEKVLKPAIEGVPMSGSVILESTPNGDTGYFYEEIQKCLRGESIYHLVVIYWWDEPDYQIEHGDAICEGKPYQGDFEYTPEEQKLVRDHNLSKAQIRWRRFKMDSLGDLFYQEYIESLDTCFLTGGMPYYDPSLLVPMSYNTSKAPYGFDLAQVWEKPVEGARYIMGVDPGQARQTESVATVIRVDEGEHTEQGLFIPRPRQVAVLGAFIEPDYFGTKCIYLGHYFNDALMNPEANSHGIAFIDAVKGKYPRIYLRRDVEAGTIYQRYGWQSNRRTKAFMMDEINRHLRNCEINDEETLKQIRAFRHDPDKPPDGYYTNDMDDRHDAWGLALVALGTGPRARRGYKGSSGHTSWDSRRR